MATHVSKPRQHVVCTVTAKCLQTKCQSTRMDTRPMTGTQKASAQLDCHSLAHVCSCSSCKLVVRCRREGEGRPISPYTLANSSAAANEIFYLDNQGRKTSCKTLQCLLLMRPITSLPFQVCEPFHTLAPNMHTLQLQPSYSPQALGRPSKCNGMLPP